MDLSPPPHKTMLFSLVVCLMHLLLRLTSFAPVWQSQTVPVPDDSLVEFFTVSRKR